VGGCWPDGEQRGDGDAALTVGDGRERVKPSMDIEVRKTDKQRKDGPRKTIRRVTRMTVRGVVKVLFLKQKKRVSFPPTF
jgi:hypothetical protein